MENLVEFGATWNLKLEIQKDANLGGKRIHRICMEDSEGDSAANRDFFWILPEEQKVCLCIPGESKFEHIKETYAVEIEECELENLPEDTGSVCLKSDDVNLDNVLCKEFVQHMMAARAKQFGMELRMGIDGNAGGCGGG